MQRLFDALHARKKSEKETNYISYKKIHPGQTRYSNHQVEKKMQREKEHGTAIWDEEDKKWKLKHDHGKSVYSHRDILPVIRAPFGYVLVDGHHAVIAGIRFGSKQVPIRVIADLSNLSTEEFWREAEQHGYVYLYKIDGKKSLPPEKFTDLQNDPNRYFAGATVRKYYTDRTGTDASAGAEYPLWIKVDKDTPYIEFMIANALYKAGFTYDDKAHGDNPPKEQIEQARAILEKAHIPGLKLIPSGTHCSDINLSDYVDAEWLRPSM